MPEQLALFDLPTASDALSAPEPRPASHNSAPASQRPAGARAASQAGTNDSAWHEAPDADWRDVQARVSALGWALDWNGQQYALYRPGWRYAHSAALAPLEALIARAETVARGVADELPDDLASAGMRCCTPERPAFIATAEGDVTFAFATLERNIAAAREFLAARARRLQAEAEAAAAKKTRKRARKRAS